MRGADLSHLMADVCQDLLFDVVVIPLERKQLHGEYKEARAHLHVDFAAHFCRHSLLYKSPPTKLHSFSSSADWASGTRLAC